MITKSELDENLSYDPKTGMFVWVSKRHKRRSKDGFAGKKHRLGYRDVVINGVSYGAHRLAWLCVHGVMPESHIDHINGIKDDNRIENLREATEQQNQMNRKRCRANTSGVKGVCWIERCKRWEAKFISNKARIFVGRFMSLDEAAAAISQARAMHHGEFARD